MQINPPALGIEADRAWTWRIPLPARKPFREAKLRMDADSSTAPPDRQLLELFADAHAVQRLVLASPELSLNQLAKREGRCRKQMGKLLRASWLSPRIIEAIADGTQPRSLNRTRLLETELPVSWARQEALLGFTA